MLRSWHQQRRLGAARTREIAAMKTASAGLAIITLALAAPTSADPPKPHQSASPRNAQAASSTIASSRTAFARRAASRYVKRFGINIPARYWSARCQQWRCSVSNEQCYGTLWAVIARGGGYRARRIHIGCLE